MPREHQGLGHTRPARTPIPRRVVATVVTAVLLFANAGAHAQTVRRDAAGGMAAQRPDTIVKLAGRPLHAGVGTLVEELSIGRDGAGDAYMFGGVQQILPLRDGTLLVLDAPSGGRSGATPFVRQYDANGIYLRTFGRHGEGPGEYMSPHVLAQLPDGRVLLLDETLRRICVYSSLGVSTDHWIIERQGFTDLERPLLLTDTAGFIYRLAPARPFARGESPVAVPVVYLRSRPGGPTIDTIFSPTFPTAPTYDAALFRTGGLRTSPSRPYSIIPFWPGATWTWSPLGYMITGVPTRYAIEMRIPAPAVANAPSSGASATSRAAPAVWRTGDPVVSIRRDVRPVPISDQQRAEERANIEFILRMGDPTWTWRGPDVPSVKPAYRDVRTGLDGRVWVSVAAPSEKRVPPVGGDIHACAECDLHSYDPPLYDVFEPDGTYVGQVRVPDQRFSFFMVMRGDIVWGIGRDSNDVQTVKRFRIVWP